MINNFKDTRLGHILFSLPAIIIIGFLAVTISVVPIVRADTIQNQINNLNAQNSQSESNLSSLQLQASSYQDAINKLQAQIAGLQGSITVNQNKQVELQAQITQDNQEITQEKQVLATDIKAMYVDGQMTTIEELATSKSLSDFVDAQTYRNAVQSKIQNTLQQIATLNNQLHQQQTEVTQVIGVLTQQQNQVSASEAQQAQLLAYNQSQQDQYNQQIQANQSQIATLVAEQIAANKKLLSSGQVDYSGTCGGSYPASASGSYGPWGCNYAHSSDYQPGCTYLDSWSMCNRECVSYTAWMVYKSYGIDVTGFGSANQWPSHAQSAGISTGSTPKAGSVAIYMGGGSDPWGHAMWVKSVNSDGTITADQYNLNYDGNFYETTISSQGLTYIYFGQ